VVFRGAVERAGDTSGRFPLASVTKPLTATAVLVAVEEGTTALDEPAGPPGSTVAHLLAHASGLAPDRAEALAPPGTRRIYSNAGFDVLADHVAGAAGMAFDAYLGEAVLEPLGMADTSLDGSAARDGVSSVDDLCRWLTGLPALLAPETLEAFAAPAFPDLAGVLPGFGGQDPNPWGLGVEVRGTKAPHWTGSRNSPATWGHFGQSGTMWWFDPTVDVGVVALTDEPFGPWAAAAWPELSDRVLASVAG
jgi:CubicO group peptidase (beta-lactamase class C family)